MSKAVDHVIWRLTPFLTAICHRANLSLTLLFQVQQVVRMNMSIVMPVCLCVLVWMTTTGKRLFSPNSKIQMVLYTFEEREENEENQNTEKKTTIKTYKDAISSLEDVQFFLVDHGHYCVFETLGNTIDLVASVVKAKWLAPHNIVVQSFYCIDI